MEGLGSSSLQVIARHRGPAPDSVGLKLLSESESRGHRSQGLSLMGQTVAEMQRRPSREMPGGWEGGVVVHKGHIRRLLASETETDPGESGGASCRCGGDSEPARVS